MSKYDQIISQGYEFEMSRYINEGWELFKKGVGGFVGFTVLYFIIVFFVSILPLVSIISSIIQYTLAAGYFIYCRKLLIDQSEFKDFFGGFKYFVQILLHGIVLMLFFIPIIIIIFSVLLPYELLPDMLSGDFDFEYLMEEWLASLEGNMTSIAFIYFLIVCLVVYIYLSYAFTLPLIVDGGLQFWDAMETSRKIIGKNFISFLIMFILLGLITSFATVLTCGLGMFAAIPFMYCVLFVAYNRITNPESPEETTSTDSAAS